MPILDNLHELSKPNFLDNWHEMPKLFLGKMRKYHQFVEC